MQTKVKGMGRRQKTDPRDHGFLMHKPAKLPDAYRKIWPVGGKSWDQKQTSMCVSFSTNKYLTASPIRNAIPTKLLPDWLKRFYKECQRNDEWDGECVDMLTQCLSEK